MNIITRPVPAPRTVEEALVRGARKLADVAGAARVLADAADAAADSDARTVTLAELARDLAIEADDLAFEVSDWAARACRG